MAKRFVLIALLVITLSSIYPFIYADANRPERAVESNTEDIEQALDATVLITLYGFEPAQQQASGIAFKMAQAGRTVGLGSLVLHDGQHIIVTHDHWSLLNAELELVQFRNGREQLLAQVTGEAFHKLIRYRDGGTMILSAPSALADSMQPVAWTNKGTIRQGTIVQVVHRRSDERGGISAVAATVEGMEAIDGVPSFRLRSMDGHVIVRGDSGGGIWNQGQLVGNLWTTLTVNVKEAGASHEQRIEGTTEANWSRAAVLGRAVQDQLSLLEEQASQATRPQPDLNVTQEPGLPPAADDGGIG